MTLLTVGHGTLSAEEFATLLGQCNIAGTVDVRRFPGSRRHPQFGAEELRRWLPRAGIWYRWEERLGGRRRRRPDSVNVGLRNASFQAYADRMAEPPFHDALTVVLTEARRGSVAIMCSESVWWRCHRRLISDVALLVHGVAVRHLLHDGRLVPHVVTNAARLIDGHVVYDQPEQDALFDPDAPTAGA